MQPDAHLWHDLSGREQEVTALLIAGKTKKEIARALKLSENTVGVHVTRIFRKANVHSTPQLIVRLYRIDPPNITHRTKTVIVARETERAA